MLTYRALVYMLRICRPRPVPIIVPGGASRAPAPSAGHRDPPLETMPQWAWFPVNRPFGPWLSEVSLA